MMKWPEAISIIGVALAFAIMIFAMSSCEKETNKARAEVCKGMSTCIY